MSYFRTRMVPSLAIDAEAMAAHLGYIVLQRTRATAAAGNEY